MAQTALAKKKFSVYDYDAKIQCTFLLIENELPKETAQLIKQYANVMTAQSMAKATIHKHLQTVLNLSRYLGKSWNEVTKEDIDALVAKIVQTYSDNGQETNTTHDHKKILKIFFRWFKLGSRSKDEVGDPPETKHVKIKRVKDNIVREDLITEEDRIKLLQACGENARDRAFIDCHLEAGTRPGEILNLQISHVKFDKFGAVLHVDGKTEPRTVRLIKSTPSLATWLSIHPFKDSPDAPLWISTRKNYFGEYLSYPSARLMVKRRCKQAKISKRVILNLFRHSEATETAKFMTEAQMKKRHGWTADSKMPARYVHLVNADVDDAIFEHHGIKTGEETIQKLPKQCAICDSINAHDSKNCFKCGKALDIRTAIEQEEKEAEKKDEELRQIRSQLEEMQKIVQILQQTRPKID
jgi:integrase